MSLRQKRLIATDLDGTLLTENSDLSTRTLEALDKAHQAGFEHVVVTGRSWRTAVDILIPAPHLEYIVCANGACIYQRSENKVTWESTIPPDTLEILLSRIRALFPTACFGWESATGWNFEPAYLALSDHSQESGARAQALGTELLYKLFFRSPDHSVDTLLDALPEELLQLAAISTSGAPFLEATAVSANKGQTLAYVASLLSVSVENCIAFGDNLNDLPMLSWVGTGVAMANAVQQLKDVADATTLSNSEDGVADYIEKRLTI